MSHRRLGGQAGLFLFILSAGVAVRLLHFAALHGTPFYELYESWQETDMYQYAAWARHLAGGDWLDTIAFRPYFSWQAGIGPPELWNSWYGHSVYYQPPFFTYLTALSIKLTGSVQTWRILQLVLGGMNCGLIALIGWRFFSPAVGYLAGAGAVCYAPFIFNDGELLRSTVTLTTQLAVILLLHLSARSLSQRGLRESRGRLTLLGASLGWAYVTDSAMALFLPLALAWLAWASSPESGKGAGFSRLTGRIGAAFALVAVGAMAFLSPLMLRNASLGAPLLSTTTRGPFAFVLGNAPDARPVGWAVPPSARSILEASGYRMFGTIAETLRRYKGDYRPLLAKQLQKMRFAFNNFEIPDNANIYYARRLSPVLRFTLPFLPIAALGIVGLWLSFLTRTERSGALLLLLFLLSSLAVIMLAHLVSRYRLPLVIPLLLFGAYALAWLINCVYSALPGFSLRAAVVAALTAFIAFMLPTRPPEGYGYHRPAEYHFAALSYAAGGDVDRARSELGEAIARAGREKVFQHDIPGLYYTRGVIEADAGLHDHAVESFRKSLGEDPSYHAAAAALRISLEILRKKGR